MEETKYTKEDEEMLQREQQELKDKLVNLVNFMNSDKFYKLSKNRRQLLMNKKVTMEAYLSVLNMMVYEDIDNIFVPDLNFVGLMGNVLGGNFALGNSSNNALKNPIEEK